MEINIIKENLENFDCGGGTRQSVVNISVDATTPLIRQKLIVAYEILSAYLDPNEHQPDFMSEIAAAIVEGIDQIEGMQ